MKLVASEETKIQTLWEVALLIFDNIIISDRMRTVARAGYAICMGMIRVAYVIAVGKPRCTRNL